MTIKSNIQKHAFEVLMNSQNVIVPYEKLNPYWTTESDEDEQKRMVRGLQVIVSLFRKKHNQFVFKCINGLGVIMTRKQNGITKLDVLRQYIADGKVVPQNGISLQELILLVNEIELEKNKK